MTNFQKFPKISRLNREVIVTEKIDGTNASVIIGTDDGCEDEVLARAGSSIMRAGSRNRHITPIADNYGFSAWVTDHADELWALGEGTHFGEWWGRGIQRGYGQIERRFSLFREPERLPRCCDVVPVIWTGMMLDLDVETIRAALTTSIAAPGYERPEGAVIYHTASGISYKYTFDKNDEMKGQL